MALVKKNVGGTGWVLAHIYFLQIYFHAQFLLTPKKVTFFGKTPDQTDVKIIFNGMLCFD